MTTATHPADLATLTVMLPDLAGIAPPAGERLVLRSATLAGTAESAAAARLLLADALSGTGGCPAADDAELVVSELAGNAFRHTLSGKGGEVQVTVAASPGEWLLILVGDDGPGTPGAGPVVPAQRPAPAESGMGLWLVVELSAAYGYDNGLSWALLPWAGKLPQAAG